MERFGRCNLFFIFACIVVLTGWSETEGTGVAAFARRFLSIPLHRILSTTAPGGTQPRQTVDVLRNAHRRSNLPQSGRFPSISTTGFSNTMSPRCSKTVTLADVPQCLREDSSPPTVVRRHREECANFTEFCCKSVYRTSSDVLLTLPLMTPAELTRLYSKAYGNQLSMKNASHWRPTEQALSIINAGRLKEKVGLTIVEMGCSYAGLQISV